MFQLTTEEKEEVVTKCDHLKTLKYSPVLPYVFTEHGAVMLASVLNSDRAIEVNIQIVRIFTRIQCNRILQYDMGLKLPIRFLIDHLANFPSHLKGSFFRVLPCLLLG